MSKVTKLMALLLVLVMTLAVFAACGGDETTPTPAGSSTPTSSSTPSSSAGPDEPVGPGYVVTEFPADATYTWHAAMSAIPGNWNPHDYEADNASTIFGYLVDGFYSITYNDELHPVEGKDPFTTYTIIPSMAAGMPKDVTAEVKAAHPDWIPDGATAGYAWEIPLRDDLYFDTGYKITAETYVQSMKYILDQRLNNYRAADIYNGSQGIVGAEAYFKKGTRSFNPFAAQGLTYEAFIAAGHTDDEVYINIADFWNITTADGKTFAKITDDTMIRDPAVEEGEDEDYVSAKYLWDNYLGPNGVYAGSGRDLKYVGTVVDFPEVKYEDTVGFYAKDEHTLVQVFKGSVSGFFLYYGGIQDSLILVEPNVYESCLKQDESGAWYSTYMTSKETSPSYGAYSMTSYQADKQVTYAKNEKWFGWHDDVNHVYKDPENGNVYRTNQTTNIDIQVIKETATRRQMFLRGDLSTFNLEDTDFEQYGHSDYMWEYPSETCAGLWLTGNMDGLNAREKSEGFNTATQDVQTIGLKSFHEAMAVSFDKQAFCDEVHPAYQPGFGLLGDQFIYDPDAELYYRDTDAAKQALCDFYGVDVSKYDSLDEAVASITGYDPDTAKARFKKAYDEAISLGYITDNNKDGICDQTITMTYIVETSGDDVMLRRIRFLNENIKKAVVGTPFEGKIEIVESAPLGNNWLNAYRYGSADMFIVGVGGSMVNPFNAFGIYCDPSQNLTSAWYNPKTDTMTYTVKGEEITMSVYSWYQALNGEMVEVGDKTYSFGSADVDMDTRVSILAALEVKVLLCYDMLPLCNFGSKILLTQQCFNVCDEYNPMFEYGPRRYNYTDKEWADYCAKQIAEHGSLQY